MNLPIITISKWASSVLSTRNLQSRENEVVDLLGVKLTGGYCKKTQLIEIEGESFGIFVIFSVKDCFAFDLTNLPIP